MDATPALLGLHFHLSGNNETEGGMLLVGLAMALCAKYQLSHPREYLHFFLYLTPIIL